MLMNLFNIYSIYVHFDGIAWEWWYSYPMLSIRYLPSHDFMDINGDISNQEIKHQKLDMATITLLVLYPLNMLISSLVYPLVN